MVKEGLARKRECNDALFGKKHIFVFVCVDMFLGLGLDLVRSGAQGAPSPDVLFLNFAETGKAVKTGHSCAAVSHQTKPTARARRTGPKPIGITPGEGEGRGRTT
jgi:hypothetical protein